MSIKHFHDLPIKTIRAAFAESSTWLINEKYDGSYIRAGLDALGQFYTARKGLKPVYSYRDWDPKPWADAFRSAHIALESFVDRLDSMGVIKPGDHMDFEIIYGRLPNTIAYPHYLANTLIMFATNNNEIKNHTTTLMHNDLFLLEHPGLSSEGSVKVMYDEWTTHHGRRKTRIRTNRTWTFLFAYDVKFKHDMITDEAMISIPAFLDRHIKFMGQTLTIEQLLETKLTKKPEWLIISDSGWKTHKPYLLEQIKLERSKYRAEFAMLCNLNTRVLKQYWASLHSWRQRKSSEIEGIVVHFKVDGNPIIAKFVDTETFGPANNFSHIVRYWLQGGRRPERPSFLSRTKDWPVEKRLERLEVLRTRFIDNRLKLTKTFRETEVSYYNNQLFERTALLFAEIKEKLENGWTGV